jgi:transcriptional adapter 3
LESEQAMNNEDASDTVASFKPATHFPDQYKIPPNAGRDFAPLEQRTLQELRYCGFVTPEATPDYDSQYDDEVAARLRYLQSELQRVSRENTARKARVLELTEERMAMQEYSTIADDLDSQINTAYLKRNRTMSKPKKGSAKGRPGGTGVAVSRNLVSEGVKMLMDRRKEWRELIGPVVDFGQQRIPKETVFDKENMERLEKVEADAGEEEIE